MAYRQARQENTHAYSLSLNCSLGLSLRWVERWSQGDDSFILAGQHLHFKRKNTRQIRWWAAVLLPLDTNKPTHDYTGTQEYSPLFIPPLSFTFTLLFAVFAYPTPPLFQVSLFPFFNLLKRLTLLINSDFWSVKFFTETLSVRQYIEDFLESKLD